MGKSKVGRQLSYISCDQIMCLFNQFPSMVAINDKNIYTLRLSVIYDDPVYLKLSDRHFIEINVSC